MTNKDAIEIIKTFRQAMDTPITEYREILLGALDMAIEALEERPQGEWIFRNGVTCIGYYKCSNCGEVERAEKNFCPNCGADMRK